MTNSRRQFMGFAASAAALAAWPRSAEALDYPQRPVQLVNGFAAGGIIDVEGRILGQRLSERLGQSFLIDNKPGAATNIATEAVVRAPADGYTLLWVTTANTINASIYRKLNFNFLRDIVPVASIDRFPLVMQVNPAVPARTVAQFIAYAKANPGKVNFGSGGIGSVQHVAGELFKFMAGVEMVHVPYRGAAPVLNDLIAGQVQVAFSPLGPVLGYIRAGQVRALAVTGTTRSDTLPDVPAMTEILPGYEANAIDGIGAPRDTPAPILEKLNAEVNAAVSDPEIVARFHKLGSLPTPMTQPAFAKLLADETEKWAKVVKFAKIEPQ